MVKKNIYRAVSVNEVEIELLRAVFADKLCVCGVDVAKTDFVAALVDADGATAMTMKWVHPKETRAMLSVLDGIGATRVDVVMESSGSYGDSLHNLLEARGTAVYRVGTKRSHDAAELFDGVPSWHDAKSASLLARLHLQGISERWHPRSEDARTLAAEGKRHERCVDSHGRLLNQLEAELARYWPELSDAIGLSSITLLELVAEMGSPQAVVGDPKKARALMCRASKNALRRSTIEAVLESARQTLGVVPMATELAGLRELASEALRMRRFVDASTAVLAVKTESDPTLRAISTAIGKAGAVRLVADAGDPTTYSSAAAYEKALGLNLKERSSGTKKGRLTITKRGSGRARRLLFMAAMRLVQQDPVVKAWHLRKAQRDGNVRIKSIVAVMRKLARAIWHLAKKREPFDASKLFDTRRLALAPAKAAA